jgi:hypothetical protein
VFSEPVIILGTNAATKLPPEVKSFETLCTMSRAGTFELVFLPVAQDSFLGKARQKLAGSSDSMVAKKFSDFLGSPPTIRIPRIRDQGWDKSVD